MVTKLPKPVRKIWKMLQCVREKIKSADEKLRSIGSKPQPSAQQHQPPHLPQQRHPQLPRHHQQQQQQQQQEGPPPVPAREPVMAERRVQLRQGRRERRRDGDGDGGDLKRRSRSEGPSARRVAQSMDVGSGSNNSRRAQNQGNASFERRGGRPSRPGGSNSPNGSDDGGGFANPDPSGSDSDSDSDRMQWTKNPLLVRKVKKNKADKRGSGADSSSTTAANASGYSQLGQRSTNRESWVYLAPEPGTPLPANTQDQSHKGDGGSNSGSLKSKYQKLEEMRKKRIDIAVTSDEENSPESRISRLRQRALQGALGTPARSDSSRVTVSDHNSWGSSSKPRAGSAVLSDQGSRQHGAQVVSQYNKQPVMAQPQAYRSGVVVQAQPANRVPQLVGVTHRQDQMATAPQPASPYKKAVTGQAIQPSPRQPTTAAGRQPLVRPFPEAGKTDGSLMARQQFYTIPEPHVGNRAVHNSSPEIQVRKFNPAARVPSADSIYDSVTYSQEHESSRPAANRAHMSGQRVVAQIKPPAQDVVELQRGGLALAANPGQVSSRDSGQSQFNEVVELRLKSARVIDRPLSQSFKNSGSARRHDEGGFRSEDSLDELIESNIQYLDREIKQAGSKKSIVPVSRSSSMPDPRKTVGGSLSKPQVTVSGQQNVRPLAQTSSPSQSNKSELHIRVPLPPQTAASKPMPQIRIAEENQWSDSPFVASNSYTFGVVPRVERKHSYDSRTRTSRPNSEYLDRDDVSKSDTQLNAAVVAPIYRGSMLHPNYATGRSCVSDQNLTVEQSQGMFSDVEYDIEVAERVKKWEKFMKKPDFGVAGEGKKTVILTPIEERTEGDRDSLMMPSQVRKSLRLTQPSHVPAAPSVDGQYDNVSLKPANSDPTLHLAGDARVLSKETNLHRFFQVVQDPHAGLQVGPHLSHSTSSIYIDVPQQSPQMFSQTATVYQSGGLMSPDELRQHMLANQRSRAELERNTAPQLAVAYDGSTASDTSDRTQRVSRYQDEIDEMKSVKHHSVSNLRRRFDEVTAPMSEDESRADPRVAKVSPTHKDGDDVNWSQMISGLEDKIRDMEVWSPNMESTQGNVVSIERVKARTLQTIPFSEDPFWKEIEEMTTFDPSSLGGHLSVSEEAIKPTSAQTAEETPHSSTLPTQPRQHSTLSARERMQRSKSLYTPNITPLTISVDPYTAGNKTSSLERGTTADKYSGPSALDEVLEDIRTSLERKPLSPKRKAAESSDSHRSSPGPNLSSELMRSKADRSWGTADPKDVPCASSWGNMASSFSSHVNQPISVTISSSQKPAAPAAAAAGVSGMMPGHYHLDPHLLKQKLLSTGLVEEDRPEPPPVSSYMPSSSMPMAMSKPVAVAPPQTVVRPVVAPTQRASDDMARSSKQQDKLNQVNSSMEELRQLAVNVERKIGMIKSRLLTADDQNLDNILIALRKYAPSAGPQSPDVHSNMQDFYHSKKTKLQDALSELDRIHTSLDLGNDMLMGGMERRDYPSYRSKTAGTRSNPAAIATDGSMPSPSRAKTSSAYISPIPVSALQADTPYYSQKTTGKEADKHAQFEFDMISKSFQAIIDEVNKTASLVSSTSTPQPHYRKPLPEIKELQSKVYASKEQGLQKHSASPETSRRPLHITVNSQQMKTSSVPTPKSPPAVAPKPSFRMPASAGPSQQHTTAAVSQPIAATAINVATGSAHAPVTSIVRAEMAKPAPEKREPRVRGRFRPKPASQEEDANRRARSKSSPTLSVHGLHTEAEANEVSNEQQTTAKTQLNFQIEPPPVAKKPSGSKKPPLHIDVARAQEGGTLELQLKPPAMFQDTDDKGDQPSVQVHAEPVIVRPDPDCAPPLDSKTVIYPGTASSTATTTATTSSCVTQVAMVTSVPSTGSVPPPKTDASSSESSAEGREKKKSSQRMGRGVAMMVELFSSSDEERIRRSHPLHTRSAPDLSADLTSDDAASVPKEAAVRPAEVTKLKTESGCQQGSPVTARRGTPATGGQSDTPSTPQSPSNKPPFHPLKRQQPSPDRVSESSPQRSAELQASVAGEASGQGKVTVTSPATPARAEAAKTTPRVRPAAARGTKAENDDDAPERPRSFHELLMSFEPDSQRLGKMRLSGKCASVDVIPAQPAVTRVIRASSFTSEPDLREGQLDAAPTPQEVRQWKLQMEGEAKVGVNTK